MRLPIRLLFLAMTMHTGAAAAQTWTPEQQELWQLEESSGRCPRPRT